MSGERRLPRKRRDADLVIQELPDELLVYDRERQEAHCLNRVAALVFRGCDGRTTVAQMVARLERAGLPGRPELVQVALDELAAARLTEADRPEAAIRRSRRQALKEIGLMVGVVAVAPIVQSMVAPSVAQAQSMACNPNGAACGNGKPCCVSTDTCCPSNICDDPAFC